MDFLYFLQEIRNPVTDAIFSVITRCGEEIIFMAVGMIFFWCVNKCTGYYLLSIGFLGTILNQFLKMVCRVPRPWVSDPDFPIVESAREAAGGYSFPSGHTQTAVGLYGGIARVQRNTVLRIAMIALAVLVAFSRMYLGVHTPIDVLASVAIAVVLVFVAYPIFQKAYKSPKGMLTVLLSFVAIMVVYLCFINFYKFPEAVYSENEIHNLISARKNGFTLFGCAVGMVVVFLTDLKWIKFETDAVWWAQIIKVVVGFLLVIAVKELLRAPLDALFDGHLFARTVRYFLIVVVGGAVWPMTFKFFPKRKAAQ